MSVVIETTIGDFTVDLFTEERPQTCRNFLKLCKIKYYNWHLFHTVQSNFIAQTGDPTGTGKGGESVYGMIFGEKARYYEAEQMPKIKHDRVGLLSMVNCGDNMLGSQFFITLDRDLQSLDGEHCIFGEIVEGLEIILKFNDTICDGDHRPYQDIRISHTVILDDPYDDPENLITPDRSPEPTKEALMSDRIGADEALDDTVGMTMEEITEMRKDKEAKAAATILEIVGDIPDADIAPPENVLFVCKLNPVTNDDDLEIIFSRFGKIIGCEVIRDRQTGDSLQYAFIEFADRKSCEDAYFKMDNVLIDDRRIHVDFSQSVSKMRWKGKGRGFLYNNDDRIGSRKVNEDDDNDKSLVKKSEGKNHRGRKSTRNNKNKYECDDDGSGPQPHRRRKENNRDDGDNDNNDDDDVHKNGKQYYRRDGDRQVYDRWYNRHENTRSRKRIRTRSRSRSQNRTKSLKEYHGTNRERGRSKSRSRDRTEQMKNLNKCRSREQKDHRNRDRDKRREKACGDHNQSRDHGVSKKYKKKRSRDKSVEKPHKKKSGKKDRGD